MPEGTRALVTGEGFRMDQLIETEAKATGIDEAVLRSACESHVSMRRFIDPAEIAYAVVCMASPAGWHAIGRVPSVDGSTKTLRSS